MYILCTFSQSRSHQKLTRLLENRYKLVIRLLSEDIILTKTKNSTVRNVYSNLTTKSTVIIGLRKSACHFQCENPLDLKIEFNVVVNEGLLLRWKSTVSVTFYGPNEVQKVDAVLERYTKPEQREWWTAATVQENLKERRHRIPRKLCTESVNGGNASQQRKKWEFSNEKKEKSANLNSQSGALRKIKRKHNTHTMTAKNRTKNMGNQHGNNPSTFLIYDSLLIFDTFSCNEFPRAISSWRTTAH